MEPHLFADVADVVRGIGPEGFGEMQIRSHRRGIKVWFGVTQKPDRVHYEAQFIPRRFVDDQIGLALEIGFHAEERDESANQAVLDLLLKRKKLWAKELGKAAEPGLFLGNDSWRRISEVWTDPDLEDPELAFEVGSRLVDYLELIETARKA